MDYPFRDVIISYGSLMAALAVLHVFVICFALPFLQYGLR